MPPSRLLTCLLRLTQMSNLENTLSNEVGPPFTLRPRLSFPLLDAFLDQFQS